MDLHYRGALYDESTGHQEDIWQGPPAYLPPTSLPVEYLECPPDAPPATREIWRGFLPERFVQQVGRRSIDLTGSFELQACVWFSGGSAHEVVFQWMAEDGTGRGLVLRRHGQDKLQLMAHDAEGQVYVWAPIAKRQWQHVTATWTPGHLALYVGGELVADSDVRIGALQDEARTGTFRIGCAHMPGLDGWRDHLRGALSGISIVDGPFDAVRVQSQAVESLGDFAKQPTLAPRIPNGRGRVSFEHLYGGAAAAVVDFEANVRAAYGVFLKPGDVAIDVGAHNGKHTLPLARLVGADGFVYAFEPLPDPFAELTSALEREQMTAWVETHNVAVSNEPSDSAEFFRVENRPGQSALRKRDHYQKPEWQPVPMSVRVITLDQIVDPPGPIRFIKTDVEGSELHVFQGASGLIAEHRPVIHMEHDEPAYGPYGIDPSTVYRFFSSRDYVIVDILGRTIRSLSEFLESDHAVGVYDYVAVPRELDRDALRTQLVYGWL